MKRTRYIFLRTQIERRQRRRRNMAALACVAAGVMLAGLLVFEGVV
ncbi:hypothetical protein [Oxalicibacterium faecigallinarum]|nr:hypothetical protein [Oxalicibacterium faecigallinarum]